MDPASLPAGPTSWATQCRHPREKIVISTGEVMGVAVPTGHGQLAEAAKGPCPERTYRCPDPCG
jgi:hypothetical protein